MSIVIAIILRNKYWYRIDRLTIKDSIDLKQESLANANVKRATAVHV